MAAIGTMKDFKDMSTAKFNREYTKAKDLFFGCLCRVAFDEMEDLHYSVGVQEKIKTVEDSQVHLFPFHHFQTKKYLHRVFANGIDKDYLKSCYGSIIDQEKMSEAWLEFTDDFLTAYSGVEYGKVHHELETGAINSTNNYCAGYISKELRQWYASGEIARPAAEWTDYIHRQMSPPDGVYKLVRPPVADGIIWGQEEIVLADNSWANAKKKDDERMQEAVDNLKNTGEMFVGQNNGATIVVDNLSEHELIREIENQMRGDEK